LLCAVVLGLIFLSAPFPRVQLVLHAMLILALAPRPGSPLSAALWALAAGWAVEGTLRLYPHFGGTAWADLTLVLLIGWVGGRWVLETMAAWLVRLMAFAFLHGLLVHGAVRLAAGPFPWGWSWLWVPLTVPCWAWLAWRLLYTGDGPGRH
jgi:hypothetical protein